jgi:hypothetical protein
MKWHPDALLGSDVGTSEARSDCLMLAIVVAASCLPYLGGLGLYSDDWSFLSVLHHADSSFLSRFDAVMTHVATRPVQAFELAGLYSLFGLQVLGYHVVNSAVLVATTLLFYLSLRQLGIARLIAVTTPLVFGLLPSYSTDRVWLAAYQATAAVFLYFVSLYSDLRFVASADSRRWLWKGLGIVGLVGSVLAYEVTGALLVLNAPVLWWAAHLRRETPSRPRIATTAVAIGSNFVFLVLAVAYKLTTTVRAELGGGYRYRVWRIFEEAAPVHFGDYGLALPWKVAQILADPPSALILGISLLVGIVVLAHLLRIALRPDPPSFHGVPWALVMLIGGLLFGAGYGFSLMTWEIGFHTTGINNRTAIAAAIGVSWVFVGVAGWMCRWLRSERAQGISFAGLIALIAASGTLVTDTVAAYWVSSARQQREVISGIDRQLPELLPGSTLLIVGLCPYDGPAPVFVTSWDVSGMLHLTYDDWSLLGDVVKSNTEVTPEGIRRGESTHRDGWGPSPPRRSRPAHPRWMYAPIRRGGNPHLLETRLPGGPSVVTPRRRSWRSHDSRQARVERLRRPLVSSDREVRVGGEKTVDFGGRDAAKLFDEIDERDPLSLGLRLNEATPRGGAGVVLVIPSAG